MLTGLQDREATDFWQDDIVAGTLPNPRNFENILLGSKGITVLFRPYHFRSSIGVSEAHITYDKLKGIVCLP